MIQQIIVWMWLLLLRPEKRTQKTKDKLKTIAGRVLKK